MMEQPAGLLHLILYKKPDGSCHPVFLVKKADISYNKNQDLHALDQSSILTVTDENGIIKQLDDTNKAIVSTIMTLAKNLRIA
ncbi:hypothetical protein NLX67_10240 [Domibacillus sp. A3M-37]|uniref:hypothetical protein n=1 Tax=Domibacillus sp. A3M-37 TaxID=2962037 RepID=UPI0020B8E5E4|nr:hypothetical protein [Domibacillus sp. A3M-37]MCP3762769.1 hypothetical protein [Domibacillus sp. A3M-37]